MVLTEAGVPCWHVSSWMAVSSTTSPFPSLSVSLTPGLLPALTGDRTSGAYLDHVQVLHLLPSSPGCGAGSGKVMAAAVSLSNWGSKDSSTATASWQRTLGFPVIGELHAKESQSEGCSAVLVGQRSCSIRTRPHSP